VPLKKKWGKDVSQPCAGLEWIGYCGHAGRVFFKENIFIEIYFYLPIWIFISQKNNYCIHYRSGLLWLVSNKADHGLILREVSAGNCDESTKRFDSKKILNQRQTLRLVLVIVSGW